MSARRGLATHLDALSTTARVSIGLAVFVSTTIALRAQEAPSAAPELPTISGRVVRESDGTPVVGASVAARPAFKNREATTTDEHGEFVRVGKAEFQYTTATRREPYDVVSYLTITAPGITRTLVDPCANAPWAVPIRVRDSATIRGRVKPAPLGPDHVIVVRSPWRDLCWPPRTGLTSSTQEWSAPLDPEGRFEIRDVPAQVPLTIRLDQERTSHGIDLHSDLVLGPKEERELNFSAPEGPLPLRPPWKPAPTEGPWIPVAPTAHGPDGSTSDLLACEIVDGWRFQPHMVGGGRWHVHGWRACNHLEALPGLRTLVAFDASGQIGLERFEVRADDSRVLPRATVAPGALLRIAFDGPEERARIALSSRGIEFAARDLPRGVVWYELVPAGEVSVRVTAPDVEARAATIDATAGTIVRVAL